MEADQEIWIRFDATAYDYFVGTGFMKFKDDVDEYGEPKLYMDCVVSLADTMINTAQCLVRRHTVMVKLGTQIDHDTAVKIELVGIRVPNIATATYWVLVMDKPTGTNDEYLANRAAFKWSNTVAFSMLARPYLELLRVVTKEGPDYRSFNGKDTYEVWFGTVDNAGDYKQVKTETAKNSLFFVNFPAEYEPVTT